MGLHDFRCYLQVSRFVEIDTSVICHAVLVHCFGSFLLQDMFLSLQVFASDGQNMTYTVSVLLTGLQVQ